MSISAAASWMHDAYGFLLALIVGTYCILGTVGIMAVFGAINLRLTRHMAPTERTRLTFRPQFLR